MRVAGGVLCVALLVSFSGARETDVDPALPRYRPLPDVVGVIQGHGSAGMIELMKPWGAGFERMYPSVRVELDDARFEDVVVGAAFFGPRLNRMREPTLGRFETRFGHEPTQVPVCFYVLAVFVHKDNPVREGLYLEEVERIFSSAFRDLTWGDLGCKGDWAVRPITLYARDRYTVSSFLRRHCSPDFGFKDSVRRRCDDAAVVASVAADPSGVGLAVIGRRTDEVRALPIAPRGSSKVVPATAENAWSGAYPLTDTVYLALNHDPRAEYELDPPRREFLRYVMSREGQADVVQAGHVPLSAELAQRALADVRLTPSGEGLWDALIERLRARRPPGEQMRRIERLARTLGEQPTDQQLGDFAKALARTGFTSAVAFEADGMAAAVKYHPLGHPEATLTDATSTLPIGLYNVWIERDGRPVSPPGAWFPVVRERERVRIYEGR